ncbi:ATP-binding protein [Candidatus Uhrbacteria bacterium]|nr:ATP-binding protein [Candidatus Uhrbacteria bacterium]
MSDEQQEYPFFVELGRAINSGSSRTIVLTGNVQDLLHLDGDGGGAYVPVADFLAKRCETGRFVPVVYEPGKPIQFVSAEHRKRFQEAWVRFQTGLSEGDAKIERFLRPGSKAEHGSIAEEFASQLEEAAGNATLALSLLQAMCACSRMRMKGEPIFDGDLIIIIEGADLLIPEGQTASLSEGLLHRLAVSRDWFTELGFLEGKDTVILIAEFRDLLNGYVSKLPQLGEVEVPFPDDKERLRFIRWYCDQQSADRKPAFWSTDEELAAFTAGLTIHVLRQLLVRASYDATKGRGPLQLQDVTKQVERFIRAQLGGDDVVKFSRPEHRLADLVAFEGLKAFIRDEIIPGVRLMTKDAISSIIVCGPNGSGKTFAFEAVAGELGIPILELQNLRSKWFGETDVITGRLRRVLGVLRKVLIYVNEADTKFGGVGQDVHETERRLTGSLQAMMSDQKLKGRVHWILDTARPHLLSPDLRRPGRGGDLIVAMFDPEGDERKAFIRWAVEHVLEHPLDDEAMAKMEAATGEYFVGAFATLRSTLKRKAAGGKMALDAVRYVVENTRLPDIGLARRYQTIQGALNCSWLPLLPPSYREIPRDQLYRQAAELEAIGIH